MKVFPKRTISLIASSLIILANANAELQETLAISDTPAAGEQAAAQQNKLIKVCTLNSVEANQEFQRNVQLMQAQRTKAIEIKNKIAKTTDNIEKARLEGELKVHLEQLNANNQQMIKTYGFSLTRNYTLVVETAHVYMFINEDEAGKYEKAIKAQQEQASTTK